jgi:hypothetical protein
VNAKEIFFVCYKTQLASLFRELALNGFVQEPVPSLHQSMDATESNPLLSPSKETRTQERGGVSRIDFANWIRS